MRLHKDQMSRSVVLLGGLLCGFGLLFFTDSVLLLFVAGVFWSSLVIGCFIYRPIRLYLEVLSNNFEILIKESINKD